MKKKIITFLMLFISSIFFASEKIKATEEIGIYSGELGYVYSSSSTIFTVWSSSASEIEVVVEGVKTQALSKESNNVWIASVGGDLSGHEYSFNVKYLDGTVHENVLDPYGRYLNADKTRNIIYSDQAISFQDWYDLNGVVQIGEKSKIIYGINIDTFTKSSSWGGISENSGKLLSLNEMGTKYNNTPTGFDHIKNLGVTYIELANLYDNNNPFVVNSNYVSGEYGYSGAIELKEVVRDYKGSNIGVIATFDVNDLSDGLLTTFNKFDSVYYSNVNIDVSKEMIQKYIKDLIVYWVREYKLSGVKIENMVMFDIEFMNDLSSSLLQINENILIYGDGSYSEPTQNMAGENNLSNLNGVRMQNGSLNYALFGDLQNRDGKGILDGNYSDEIIETLKFTWLSSVDNGDINYSLVKGVSNKGYWGNLYSYQLINYFGERNGLSVYDKLKINNLISTGMVKQKMVLGFGTMMVSGGIPYIEAGNEFLATYQNFDDDRDSVCISNNMFCFYFKEDDKVLDWSYAYENDTIVDALKSLVNFRKSDIYYIQASAKVLQESVEIYKGEAGNLGYLRTYENAYVNDVDKVLIMFNYSQDEYMVEGFDEKGWKNSYQYNLSGRENGVIVMKANSIYFESRIKQPKINQWIALIIVLGIIGLIYCANVFLNKKLVEQRGYDIKDINKKYRPFINKRKIENNKDDNVDKIVADSTKDENKDE